MESSVQAPSTIFMVRPINFGLNQETCASNSFQQTNLSDSAKTISQQATREFDELVMQLKNNGIKVLVFEERILTIPTPDAVFPNNWISFHHDGTIVLYPMLAKNRRLERRCDVINELNKEGYEINKIIDLSYVEKLDKYLEGTGSIIFDHDARLAYANISPRTDETLLTELCDKIGYTPVVFHAVDKAGQDIYHTNVLMCIADRYVVICMECIHDHVEQKMLLDKFVQTNKTVITISLDQMEHFAGNMIQLENEDRNSVLVMSKSAFLSLSDQQKTELLTFNPIIHSDLSTIEKYGGGSARCMIAGVHLINKK